MTESADSFPTLTSPGQPWHRPILGKTNLDATERLKPAVFWALYKYADIWDYAFTFIGLIGAMAYGYEMFFKFKLKRPPW